MNATKITTGMDTNVKLSGSDRGPGVSSVVLQDGHERVVRAQRPRGHFAHGQAGGVGQAVQRPITLVEKHPHLAAGATPLFMRQPLRCVGEQELVGLFDDVTPRGEGRSGFAGRRGRRGRRRLGVH